MRIPKLYTRKKKKKVRNCSFLSFSYLQQKITNWATKNCPSKPKYVTKKNDTKIKNHVSTLAPDSHNENI